jgi:aryl-alcohol dehydrogenase-like predicted oxidoreductase
MTTDTLLNGTIELGDGSDRLVVNRLGFGAMRLTRDDGSSPGGRDAALAVARRAVELGVTFIDTADSYGLGANEELLAEALHPYPEGLVIGTKAGQSRPGLRWEPLGRPEYLRQQCELSLRRLRVDRIDLFQLHRVDPQVPLADQVGALVRLREEGKIRLIGLSEVTTAQLAEARRLTPVASVQNRYHLTDRTHADVLAACAATGTAFIPWLPVANGGHTGGPGRTHGALASVAAELGATPIQVALAWLLHHSPVTVPIPGTTSAAHLAENVAAAALRLSPAQLARLDVAPSAGDRRDR